MNGVSTLEFLIRRQIRRSVTIPVTILSLATFGLVIRHALLESVDQARIDALRGAIALDQSTIALEEHWRTSLEAARAVGDLEGFLGALQQVDSSVCLVSLWEGDTLRWSHPRRDESNRPPRTGPSWTGAERDPRCAETVVRHTLSLDSGRTVVVSFRLSQLSRRLLDPQRKLDDHLSLVDAKGVYVADFRSDLLDQSEVDPLSGRLHEAGNQTGFHFENGRLVGYAAQRLRGPPWTLVGRRDVLETIRGLIPLLALMVFFLAVSILVGVRVRRKAVRHILAPLEDLRASLDALEVGRFEKRLEPSGLSELDNLAETFNRMAEAIESREAARLQELERAVEGLESFSYTVSHDLRSPLRAIDGYAHVLEDDEAPRLSAEGRGTIERIKAATRRMQRLIDDLLRLSRTKRCDLQLEPVDVDAMVREVAREEGARFPDRSIRWEIAPLGEAVCDPGLFRQAWSNLVSNALKYSSVRADIAIRISRTDAPDSVGWTISDNGVGFDPLHADKLFGTFQRLHTDKAFEGTGIGLALVRSIVERHQGRVSGDAIPDQGATFRIQLPRKVSASGMSIGSSP